MAELEQAATNYETLKHIQSVGNLIFKIINHLLNRAILHDKSKLESPEVEGFTEHTHKLKHLTYGEDNYEESLSDLKSALAHHYANNRHHPEHFKNGVNDMNLVDLIEMFADWKASSGRQHDGNLRKSLMKNAERFGIDTQLYKILENTIELFDS